MDKQKDGQQKTRSRAGFLFDQVNLVDLIKPRFI